MSELLISANQLRAESASTVIFDCRFALSDPSSGEREFRAGHIPGADRLDMEKDLSGEKTGTNGRHPLPLRTDLQDTLRSAGVRQDSRIVLYDTNRLAGAARAWWLLTFFGLADVRILDGGFQAWREAGYELEKGPARQRVHGEVILAAGSRDMLATRSTVLAEAQLGSGTIIDTREPARFAGEEEPIDPIAGRIPTARNLPWLEVTDENSRVIDADSLRTLFQQVDAGDDPVVYCGSGVTASVVLFVRAVAGLPGGRLYPGSWSEWCADPNLPIERSGSASQ